jgi:hypothetical protein
MNINMNISTEEGMKAATQWQQDLIDSVKDGGSWVVPRSGTTITFDKGTRTAVFISKGIPEPDIKKVLERMGWAVIKNVC